MEEIGKTYGGAILAGLCFFLMCLFVCGTGGMLEQSGAFIDAGGGWEAGSRTGFLTYEKECVEIYPDIRYVGGSALKTGTYALSNLLEGVPGTHAVTAFYVLSVRLPDGSIMQLPPDVSELSFSESGVYTLRVRVKDSENRQVLEDIHIPVNEGGRA